MRLFSLNAFLMLVLALILPACTTQPENFNDKPKERAQAHADLGAVYLQQGRLDVALEEFSLASKIETEMTYPGQVRVTVIREKRAVGIAR